MIRLARITVSAVISAVAIAWLLVACIERPPSTPDGHDPDADSCCWGLVLPWLDAPEECLCDYTEPGTERWLTCAGGVVEYTCDLRGEP